MAVSMGGQKSQTVGAPLEYNITVCMGGQKTKIPTCVRMRLNLNLWKFRAILLVFCNFFPYLHERTVNVTMYAILCLHRPLATVLEAFSKLFPAGPIIVDVFFTPQGQKLQFCFVHFSYLDKAKRKQAAAHPWK
jgi:hypothetical protein